MWNEASHWQTLGLGLGLLLAFYFLYWCMIKSAMYWRYRLYQNDVTVPILNELHNNTTEEKKTDI